MTQLVLQRARGSRHVGKRTFTNVIFRVSNLANLNLHLRKRNRNVRVGCIVSYYNISRRGLTRVAYLDEGAMREPETWDKREVVTPTSFIEAAVMKLLKALVLILSFMTSISMLAQRERNYIYLLDCTKSMTGFGGHRNIWEPTKNYLKQDINKHPVGTTLHVVPFQGNVLPSFNFVAGKCNWKEIESALDDHVQKITNTNICDAWGATDNYIDSHKDNYIILLTDGHDNVKGMDALVELLAKWCGKHHNTYAFYVLLTEKAIDNRVTRVINLCENEYVVDATKGIPVFGSLDKTIIYANTLNLKKTYQIGFSSAGVYSARTICKDPYFNVKVAENKIKNGIVPIQISAKHPIDDINKAIPQVYDFSFEVKSNEVEITNPIVTVVMTNKPERSLETISEETDMGKATWYDSFLFWDASNPDTLKLDLNTVFNNEAKKDGSNVKFAISDPDGENDFQILLNGQSVDNNSFVIKSNENNPSIISLVFNPGAKEGTRYLEIKASSKHELDKINDVIVEQYRLVLRSKYKETWNPLKTILLWIAILIMAALLLWLLLIKHFVYPTIRVNTIQINDPYFSRVKVKGKRRVVFTNQKKSQSLFSKIFTGPILYKRNEIWTSPLCFEAGAKKRTLRLMRTKDYTFDPYASSLKAPNDYIIENVNDKTRIKITIN